MAEGDRAELGWFAAMFLVLVGFGLGIGLGLACWRVLDAVNAGGRRVADAWVAAILGISSALAYWTLMYVSYMRD